MVQEVLTLLRPQPGARLLDGTVGGGGHAAALLEASSPESWLVGLDRDEEALAVATRRLVPFFGRYALAHENFCHAQTIARRYGIEGFDGVLLDLGFSSLQVDDGNRGFSFQRPGPLDMRMDRREDHSASDIVNQASESELRHIFHTLGEERAAGTLARALVRQRREAPLTTTEALVRVIEKVIKRSPQAHLHPATRAFQALRISVNHELDHLSAFLRDGYRLLRPGGRMVILSYHSLEDRLVKDAFRYWAASCHCPPQLQACLCGWTPQVRILTPKPLTPTSTELTANPRARSARLRAVERCSQQTEA
jgi:16S rRNA (cytosine1402-N4)-methyltransferase